MAKALGTDAASEHLPGLSKLTPYLKGEAGLLCTPRTPEEVQSFFSTYSSMDFPRSNTVAAYTFTIPKGIVYSRGGEIPAEEDMKVAHSVEPQLRKCGMPTRLDKGTVMLDVDYTVCKEGEVLNSHKTALLKAFGVAMAEFRVKTLAYWHSESGEVTKINEEEMETDD
jgi:mRNA turnover protein 4